MATIHLFCLTVIALVGLAAFLAYRSYRSKQALIEMRKSMEAQKMSLAEASVNLLERTEKLQEQKLEIAEANLKLMELTEQLKTEKDRSERLLLNILPLSVANDLKMHGRTEPQMYEEVTVLFSDLVDFTSMSERLDPVTLINELNDIFTAFDTIIERHGCERIKTIGDAYLALCGMPLANARHTESVLDSALEILEYLKERNTSAQHAWHIRIGIHTGRVVGGVVGVHKYIYDVFGDTINTASRMESNSAPMCINVSETSYSRAKDNYNFEPREPIEVKGKGLQRMYFLKPSA
jgi:class 3 adenylate cyclase